MFTRLLPVIFVLLIAFWLRAADLDSMPPGLSNDEAVNAIDAFHIAKTGNFPIYEDANRPEPLFRLVQTAGVLLFGPGIWTFRYTSALVGVLTVAAAYGAARECTSEERIGALAAAGALTVALGHITVTRTLYRAVPQPLFMFFFVGLLLRGFRTKATGQRRLMLIFSGASLAAALYTYTAALVLPAALAPFALSLLLFRRARWRVWLPRLFFFGAALAVLLAPLGLRFLARPETVMARAAQVGSGDTLSALGPRLEVMAAQFFTAGDENPQYNVAGAPLLPPVFNLLFVVGLLALALRIRQPAAWLVGALLVLAALPALLSDEITHGLRVMGEFAALPLVIGMGASGVARLSFLRSRAASALLTVGLLALTVLDAAAAWNTYRLFWEEPERWPAWRVHGLELTHNAWFFRPDRRDLARWIAAQEGPLLVPVEELNTPTTRAWLMAAYPDVHASADEVSIPEGARVVTPWALELGDLRRDTRHYALLEGGVLTVLPPFAEAPSVQNGEDILRDGQLAQMGQVAPFATPGFEPRAASSKHVFEGGMQLLGWRGPDTLLPDDMNLREDVTYTLEWSAAHSYLPHEYRVFTQLWTQEGERVAGSDLRVLRWLYPPTVWRAGEGVPVEHSFGVSPLPPGAYRLAAGVYVFQGEWLPTTNTAGEPVGDVATLGWVKVPQVAMPSPRPETLGAVFGEMFVLQDAQATIQSRRRLYLALYWESLAQRPDLDATVFVHLLDASGDIIAQADRRPHDGNYPTFIWDRGERVRTEYTFELDAAHVQALHVAVGMYTFPDMTRLPVADAEGEPAGDMVHLGELAELVKP